MVLINLKVKKCSKCVSIKQLSRNFYNRNRNSKQYVASWCKNCVNKARIDAIGKYHKTTKNNGLRKKYGLSIEKYEEMVKSQNNLCAICKKEETAVCGRLRKIRSLAVDHCHMNGQIRGLLCGNCNQALGKFKDSIACLKNAISYLEYYGKN